MVAAQGLFLICLSLSAHVFLLACAVSAGTPKGAHLLRLPDAPPSRVIFDHDGGIDDFITLLLLLSQRANVEIVGVVAIGADSIPEVALNTTLKLMDLLDASHVPVALSTLPATNPFPLHWRCQGSRVDVLPLLNQHPPKQKPVEQPGQDFLLHLLQEQEEPVDIIATGPLTNIAYAMQKGGPAVAAKISSIWWMGGALAVPGNVAPHPGTSDTRAEWNAYWDPPSMGVIWNSSVPLVLVPLDATNNVPVTAELLYGFGPQAQKLYSNLAGSIWSSVMSWIQDSLGEAPYYAWDTLTAACYLARGQQLCNISEGVVTAACVSGESQGRTLLLQPEQLLGEGAVATAGGGTSCAGCAAATAEGGGCRSAAKATDVVTFVATHDFNMYVLKALDL